MDDLGNVRFANDYLVAGTIAFATINNGNVYLAGMFDGTMDFDPGIGVMEKSPQSLIDKGKCWRACFG